MLVFAVFGCLRSKKKTYRGHRFSRNLAFWATVLFFAYAPSVGAAKTDVPRAPWIAHQVDFWRQIYGQIPTTGGIWHDSRNPQIRYSLLELPKTLSDRAQDRLLEKTHKRIQTQLRKIATLLEESSKKPLADNVGAQAQNQRIAKWPEPLQTLFRAWPAPKNSQTFVEAAKNLRFQRGQADRFGRGIERSGRWLPHIKKIFARYGLPKTLIALPHVESSFRPGVRSHAGAAGMFQFTRGTGRSLLRIRGDIDERLDPLRATVAAAKLLRRNFDKTKAWPVAITAYNHGLAGMRRAVRQVGSDDISVIVQRHNSRTFGFASRNFYAELLAAYDVSQDPNRFMAAAYRPTDIESPIELGGIFEHTLKRAIPASTIARHFAIPIDTLQKLNPAVGAALWGKKHYLPRGYTVRLRDPKPPAMQHNRKEKLATLAKLVVKPPPNPWSHSKTYKVRRGDALSTIANRLGVSIRALAKANRLNNVHRIYAGQRLRIPR